MSRTTAHSDDVRRQLTLWVLLTAEVAGIDGERALRTFEEAFVAPHVPPTATEKSPWFAIERLEDYLPEPAAWLGMKQRVSQAVMNVMQQRDVIDAHIAKASPRWRMDRMPVIDRTLLRMGVAEFMGASPRPRATLNGLIELAKRVGTDTTPGFINGILDQIRRNLEIPFA